MKKIVKYIKDGKCILLNLDNFRFVKVNEELLKDEDKLMNTLSKKFGYFREKQNNDRKTVYYMTTKKCNMNCDFCANDSSPDADTSNDINIDDLKNILIPKLEKFNVRRIIISGGEPLVRKDFKILITQFSRSFSKEKLVLQTNGLLLNKELIYFLSDKVAYIEMSIENIVADRKLKRKMEQVFEIIKEYNINMAFSFVVTAENRELVQEAIDLCVKYHAYFELRFVAPLGRASVNSNLILNERDILNVYIHLIDYILRFKLYETGLEKNFFFKIDARESCGAMGNILAIQPNGDTYMCPNLQTESYCYGNMIDNSSDEICNAIRLKCLDNEIRKKFLVGCRNTCDKCKIKYFCTGICVAELDENNGMENRLCDLNMLFYDFMLFEYKKTNSIEDNLKIFRKYIKNYLEEKYD